MPALAELIVVDDASTDSTPRLLAEMGSEGPPRFRFEVSSVNQGHGPTLAKAIALASGDWIFHVDSDGQFDASEFWQLWAKREEADLVLGVRRDRKDPKARLVLAYVERAFVSLLAGESVPDPNSPFKLFKKAGWDQLLEPMGMNPFAPSIMLSLGAALRGWTVAYVPVTHLPREHGSSSLLGLRLLRSVLKSALQTWRFSRRVRTNDRKVSP
jgi:glycosyltransferase involved in cell wall biosynthesis